ncbi:MAG TPA: class I SAM-dependent methyltransferase [Acidimicrobiales bacterium]|nr:class I SAM-dependent methyltransferase [Acidimicrobiales bacterium]
MRDEASRTAMGSAVLRAAHVRQDPPPWILEDTLSERLLSDTERRTILAEIASWPPDVAAAFRRSHAARTRLAEDVAVGGIAAGRPRYVMLGAGLDSFAWRHPHAGALEVVEIDHPATQEWKRRRLAQLGLETPPNLRFVPVDLARSALPSRELGAPATWSWLGVTMYLGPGTVKEVLHRIGGAPEGTTLVVNFLLAEEDLGGSARIVRATSQRTVQRAGEPIRSTYTRRGCEDVLTGAGFGSVEVLDSESLAARYRSIRPELQLPATTLVAVARV